MSTIDLSKYNPGVAQTGDDACRAWQLLVRFFFAQREHLPTSGNELELSIPRELLKIKTLRATLDFKWADNMEQTGEPSDFTLNGDAAPNDRFNYRAVLK